MEAENENELTDILINNKRSTKIDCSEKVKEFIDGVDWRIFANSNTGYSHAALINNLAGCAVANFWLDSVYSKEEGDAHRNGDYHIHDLDNLAGYCFTGDTKIRVVFDDNPTEVHTRSLAWLAAYKKSFKVYTMLVESSDSGVYYASRTSAATNCRQTRIAKVVKLTFNNDDNDVVACTPDHKFRLENGNWVEAKDLTHEMKLLTLTRNDYHVTKIEEIDEPQHVYCLEELDTGTHSFALANGVIVHNCCGHDLQKLLDEGFNGVMGRVGSKPPKHLREALYQMANFIGILQSEWAGAQAFSSFDTYLAPYVFFDKYYGGMSEDDVKKAIRNFVYNLNVPSRWGQCVPETYRCLKADGTWAYYKDLKIGDEIYVVDMETGKLKKDKLTHINVFDAPKKMHRYYSTDGFGFEVTDQHRVIHRKKNGEYVIQPSNELLNEKEVEIPIAQWGNTSPEWYMENEFPVSDEELELMAYFFISEGVKEDETLPFVSKFNGCFNITLHKGRYENLDVICDFFNIEYRCMEDGERKVYYITLNDRVNWLMDIVKNNPRNFINSLSPRQASKLLDQLILICGDYDGEKWVVNETTIGLLISSCVLRSGKGIETLKAYHFKTFAPFISPVISKKKVKCCKVEEITRKTTGTVFDNVYQKVWCPTTDTGTFVCLTNEGYVFFTGNSPFSNVTIDWYVPELLRDKIPSRSGENFFLNAFKEIEERNPDYRNSDGYKTFINEVRSRLGELATGDDELDLMGMSYSMFQKEMHIINRCYYEVLNEGDVYGQPFTFPIPTINITEDFDWYGENTDLLFENAAKYGSSYFQNFIGSQFMIDENGDKVRDPEAYSPKDLRSMAFLGSQEIVYRDENNRVSKNELRHLVRNWLKAPEDKKPKYEFLINGKFEPITEMFEIEYNPTYTDCVEITLENGYSLKVSRDHKCAVWDGNSVQIKLSQDITSNDKFLIGKNGWNINNGIGDYESGFLVGYYLAKGWFNPDEKNDTTFVISIKKEDIAISIKDFFNKLGCEVEITEENNNAIFKIVVYGRSSCEFFEQFVSGENITTKRLTSYVWNTSDKFRNGIYDGFCDADANFNNILVYTTNENLVEDLIVLASSIGRCFTYKANNENGSYKLYLDSFEQNYDYYIVPVKEVEIKPCEASHVYNFTIDTDEHLVELPNGIISHQCCRLQLSLKELRKKGGGLFGADSQTGCYSSDTEVLTEKGWKNFEDVTFEDKFYTLNADRKIELHNPINIFKYPYSGDMLHFENEYVDLLVTPNHRMLYVAENDKKLEFKEAKDCSSSLTVPIVGELDCEKEDDDFTVYSVRNGKNKKVDISTWMKFLGVFIARGRVELDDKAFFKTIVESLKEREVSFIDSIMEKMPYDVERIIISNNIVRWTIKSKSLWGELSSYDEVIPNYVFNYSKKSLMILFETLTKTFDGLKFLPKENFGDMQRLGMLLGYGSVVKSNGISFYHSDNIQLNGYSKVPYNDNVYCVEVPNNTLFVRRNNKVVWCGNSVGVVTFNMSRLGYKNAGNEEKFYKDLDRLLDMAKSTLEKKRKVINVLLERGLYPYTKRYLPNGYSSFFSTIGVNGMNEMIRNYTNDEHDITDEYGQKFAKDVLDHIRQRLVEYQQETGNLYNLEASPAEGTNYRLCKCDIKAFPKKKINYILCEKHGRVEISKKDIDENGEAVCPICLKENLKE